MKRLRKRRVGDGVSVEREREEGERERERGLNMCQGRLINAADQQKPAQLLERDNLTPGGESSAQKHVQIVLVCAHTKAVPVLTFCPSVLNDPARNYKLPKSRWRTEEAFLISLSLSLQLTGGEIQRLESSSSDLG